jgi:DNA-binding NarL/FixJ family response regulator
MAAAPRIGDVTRVLLVDDHPLFRGALRDLLVDAGLDVIAEAGDMPEAIAALDREPDLVIMDIGLPGADGIEATRRILALRPGTKVLVMTMYEEDSTIARALEAGASGYLIKAAPADDVRGAIDAVVRGAFVVGAPLAERVRLMASGGAQRGAGYARDFPELTDRERQVLALLSDGLTNAAIAERLGLSGKTVANYVSSILSRLEVPDRTALVALIRRKRD